jgi:centromere protein S
MDMDMDMETLADDADADATLAGDIGGEAERYEAAEAEADLLRDRLRLAVISIATAEGSIAFSREFLRSVSRWLLRS